MFRCPENIGWQWREYEFLTCYISNFTGTAIEMSLIIELYIETG
jgi:hypothetical protein